MSKTIPSFHFEHIPLNVDRSNINVFQHANFPLEYAIFDPKTVFILIWTEKKALIGTIPNRYVEMSLNLIYKINIQLGGFVRARLLEALCVGLTCFIGLTLLGVKYTAVLAIIAGLTNLIPYIGPVIGAIPALIIAFVDTGNPAMLLWVSMVYGIAQLIDMLVIIPAVFAKIVNMHPLAVVIVIIVGGQLGGVIGMILAVPVYSITRVTVKEIHTGLTSLRT